MNDLPAVAVPLAEENETTDSSAATTATVAAASPAPTAQVAAESASGAGGGDGRNDTASQQMITAVGGEQQNPCGSNIASLFFVTQQDFGACAEAGDGHGTGGGTGTGGGRNDTASQQMITAVGGEQQNPCGSNIASLFFVTQQDFGACA
ncbi:MAG: hypothetical protein ACRD0G_13670, partial [Acidimicrobiales bacterium]